MEKLFSWLYSLAFILLVGLAARALVQISQTPDLKEIPVDRPSPVITNDSLSAGASAFLLQELKSYRAFIEAERREYQGFLTRVYATIGVLLTALAGGLAFLGIKTLEELKRKSEEKIEAAQAAITEDFAQALQDIKRKSEEEIELARQKILQEAREEMHNELDRLLKKELEENEKVGKALAALSRRQALWSGASIRIIGSPEIIKEMTEEGVIPYFRRGSAKVISGPFQFDEEKLSQYDAVVYCYEPLDMYDQAGTKHDPYAAETIKAAQEAKTPLVIYTYRQGSQDNRLDKFTFAAINAYMRGTAANFPASLISNTYDAITLYGQPAE